MVFFRKTLGIPIVGFKKKKLTAGFEESIDGLEVLRIQIMTEDSSAYYIVEAISEVIFS
jgi:hypothetical protein